MNPLISIELWFSLMPTKPVTNELEVTLSGLSMSGVGKKYPIPTWDMVFDDIDAQRMIELMKLKAESEATPV
jgi:hypothetical protein